MAGHKVAREAFQTVLETIFPPHCLSCRGLVLETGGLCPDCWREARFIFGHVCDACGAPLPGEGDGHVDWCDDCLTVARPWSQGRSVFVYKGTGRALVMALKHGDRQDIVPEVARWMLRSAGPILAPDMLVAPVPLHWTRFWKRRFNQSALLAREMAKRSDLSYAPDLLQRTSRTKSLDGLTRDARFTLMQNRIRLNPRWVNRIRGRDLLLVDDVMTSGATLAAATEACLTGKPRHICVVTLARVQKDA